ncbi:hypothetical protein LTR65_007425 [Meristemomyces frigidus]
MARKTRKKSTPLSTPLSTRYHRCNKTELASFATNRGLHVVSTSNNPRRGPNHDDYVRALKQADAATSFRFLDLPPEMRNMVYKELVVLQDSWYCHPQILATCQQVHDEATSILYGDNLIEVKIYKDGVIAHGKRCGPYVPAAPHGLGDFRTLVWPGFLLRVQHLRIAVVELPRHFARMASVGNILASLCSFLAPGHGLWSLAIDLEWLPRHGVVDGIESALYPLHLLSPVPRITIKGFADVTLPLVAEIPRADPAANRAPCGLAAIEILECAELCSRLKGKARPALSDEEHMRLEWLGAIGRGMWSLGLNDGETWAKELLKYVDSVRVRHERAGPWKISHRLRTQVEEALRKGIDLRQRRIAGT